MYSSGTLTFVTCPFSGLISSARPSRTARQPSSTMHVSPPACPSNVEPAGAPPWHAAIHSAYTPCERGYFGCCAGGGGSPLATPCFAAVSSLGASPYVPAGSLPSLPIHSCPPPPSNGQPASSPTSTRPGGVRLPARPTT